MTLELGRGKYPKYAPYAFTEHGVAMLSTVLNSQRAIQVSIAVIRVFVKLREMLANHKDLSRRLDELEKRYDVQFKEVFDAIRQMMASPKPPQRRIEFHAQQMQAARQAR
ncbi:MAG: hypothetical protein HY211_02975 [Candidatus Omnitrophica bacterium]|nr:hypothetical protein [Candidatus Omnitrophota bacterium]